jgi:hypothetical protein
LAAALAAFGLINAAAVAGGAWFARSGARQSTIVPLRVNS